MGNRGAACARQQAYAQGACCGHSGGWPAQAQKPRNSMTHMSTSAQPHTHTQPIVTIWLVGAMQSINTVAAAFKRLQHLYGCSTFLVAAFIRLQRLYGCSIYTVAIALIQYQPLHDSSSVCTVAAFVRLQHLYSSSSIFTVSAFIRLQHLYGFSVYTVAAFTR